MPVVDIPVQHSSRRGFIKKSSLASVGLLLGGTSLFSRSFPGLFGSGSHFFGVQIGVTTYSFRSLPGGAEHTLKYILDSGLRAAELKGDPAEAFAGIPVNPLKNKSTEPTDEEKAQLAAYEKQVSDWRASVPMDKFIALRKMYNDAGVDIYAFKPDALGPKNTDAEIEYALKAAKALGARSATVELPADPAHSKRLGELAEKHRIFIGYHAHLQASDTAWDIALSQSPFNSMNLDCGHYIAAGGNNTKESLLALIESKHDRITSLHLKDRKNKLHGGANMPWGQGDTPLREILTLMKNRKYTFPATIELEYDIHAGSDAVAETRNCLQFAQKIIGLI